MCTSCKGHYLCGLHNHWQGCGQHSVSNKPLKKTLVRMLSLQTVEREAAHFQGLEQKHRHTQAPHTLKRERLAATLSFALSSNFSSSTGKTQEEKNRTSQKPFHENYFMKSHDFQRTNTMLNTWQKDYTSKFLLLYSDFTKVNLK